MTKSDNGEFELVVGNRQLLSGFFIVILLLAVTFAMGYVVGQNSPRSAKPQADAGSQAPAAGSAAPGNRPQPSPAAPSAAVAPSEAAAPPGQQPGDGSTEPPPGNITATLPAAVPAPDGQPPAAGASAAPAPAAANANAAAPAPTGPVSELAPGSYWQVMALHQADAEVLVRTLRDMGLPALMSPAPNNLMRVLVGPYTDSETMGRAKSHLENAGFHPIKK
jgi:hypothetical protein